MASDGWAYGIVRALIRSDPIQQFYIMMQYLTHKSKEPQVGEKPLRPKEKELEI